MSLYNKDDYIYYINHHFVMLKIIIFNHQTADLIC